VPREVVTLLAKIFHLETSMSRGYVVSAIVIWLLFLLILAIAVVVTS
jgi:hypothetical protein